MVPSTASWQNYSSTIIPSYLWSRSLQHGRMYREGLNAYSQYCGKDKREDIFHHGDRKKSLIVFVSSRIYNDEREHLSLPCWWRMGNVVLRCLYSNIRFPINQPDSTMMPVAPWAQSRRRQRQPSVRKREKTSPESRADCHQKHERTRTRDAQVESKILHFYLCCTCTSAAKVQYRYCTSTCTYCTEEVQPSRTTVIRSSDFPTTAMSHVVAEFFGFPSVERSRIAATRDSRLRRTHLFGNLWSNI